MGLSLKFNKGPNSGASVADRKSWVDYVNGGIRRIPTWPLYFLSLIPVPYLLYLAQTGGLGREPIKALEHELGELALKLLILGLAVTPLRRFAGINLLKFRRMFGLLAFAYVSLHLLVWLALDLGILSQIWADILKRPYITVGMAAFALMIPLAVTSNNRSIRRLGRKWHQLHRAVYVIAILGAVHFIMVQKLWELEPLIYLSVILVLVALRFPKKRKG